MERTKLPGQSYPLKIDDALELFSSDIHLIINKRLLECYGPNTAVFLSNLIDKYLYFKQRNQLMYEGSFFLTHEKQSKQLGLTIYQIRECKKVLKADGVISTEKRGSPAKEYYKIHTQNLLEKTSVLNFRTQELRELEHSNKGSQNLNIIGQPKDRPEKLTLKKKNELYLPIAKYLSEVIKTTKNITHTTIQINSWANEIRRLVEQNKVPPKRVKEVLKWYKIHVGDEYVPVIESGLSLRQKFTRLEDAIQRDKKPINNKKPKTILEDGRKWILDKDGDYVNSDGEILS